MRTRTCPVNPVKFVRIVRPPAQGKLEFVPADDYPTLVVVHRHGKRTVECLGDDCPFCESLMVQQDRIFMRAHIVPACAPAIVELPPSHWERLVTTAEDCAGLRSLLLTCWRRGGQPNSPIEISSAPRVKPLKVYAWRGELLGVLSDIWRDNTDFALSELKLPNRQPDVLVKQQKAPERDL